MISRANNGVIIAVLGVTGAGKSSLIREITGDQSIIVGHELNSCTAEVTPYTFQHDGENITLVDTPGFNDTTLSDVEVLRRISTWAVNTYTEGQLSGILYLHRISDNRMDGSSLRSLGMLKKLVGQGNMKNVVLATTHWSRVQPEEGEKREKELRETENFWKGMLGHGATLSRYEGDRRSGLELIHKIIPSELSALDIQSELVDQGKELAETSAGKSVTEDLKKMQEGYEKKIRELKDEFREALAARDAEMKDILEQEQSKIAAKIEQVVAAQMELSKIQSPARGLLDIDELPILPSREALLIYVKATLEFGNVGLSGSLLSSLLLGARLRSRLAIQGVYYNPLRGIFSIFTGGSRTAAKGVIRAVREGMKCQPQKKIFLCGYGQGAMIIREALSELQDSERARISGLVFVGDLTCRGSMVPGNLEDKLLDIRLPFIDAFQLSMVLPGVTFRCREIAFPDVVKFIGVKMGRR